MTCVYASICICMASHTDTASIEVNDTIIVTAALLTCCANCNWQAYCLRGWQCMLLELAGVVCSVNRAV